MGICIVLTPLGAFKIIISKRDRINRSEFSLYTLYSIVFNALLVAFFLFTISFPFIFWVMSFVIYIVAAILQLTSLVKRGHDLGISGFITVPFAILVPVVIIPLMLVPGTRSANSYGASLRESAEA